MQDIEEEPLQVIFNENDKEKNHYALKFNINDEELPTKYEWIFDLMIEANYEWFGKNRIILFYDSKIKNCEDFYELARTLIGIYNYSIVKLELLGIEEMKKLLESDRNTYRKRFAEITKRYANEEYKNKTLWNEFNYLKSLMPNRNFKESDFEKFYNNTRSLEFFLVEVFLKFYNKIMSTDSTNSTLKPNQAEESEPPKVKGVSLSYSEIATLYFLNGSILDYAKAEDITLFHGKTSRTSGKQLIEKYWKVIEKEGLGNRTHNREIYTHKNSYQVIKKIIPLLEKEEDIKLANEYLKKSEGYRPKNIYSEKPST